MSQDIDRAQWIYLPMFGRWVTVEEFDRWVTSPGSVLYLHKMRHKQGLWFWAEGGSNEHQTME